MLLIGTQAFAGDWTSKNTATEIVWQAVNVIDWGQTLDIADKCRKPYVILRGHKVRISESNDRLGKCPTFSAVNKHFIWNSISHFGISYLLPNKYRVGYQWLTIGYGIHIIQGNAHVGIRVRF